MNEDTNQKLDAVQTSSTSSSQLLDLRGISCPLNFVKTKIQLDKMHKGEVLEVWLDAGEPTESVSRSIIEEGHKITLIQNFEDYFKLIICKS